MTIISRLCINHLQSARVQREEYVGQWLPEPLLTRSDDDPSRLCAVDETLSMAFLVLLERLTPVERAVFLLREVFDYEYPEIARILVFTEANCRQILARARQHIADVRPRFDPSPEQRDKLVQVCRSVDTGDMQGLLALRASDVVLYADGGGKAAAVPNPIHGLDHVTRFILGALKKFVPPNVARRVTQINGQPGFVNYHEGRPSSVVTMDVTKRRIRTIYVTTNPEKLQRLPLLQ